MLFENFYRSTGSGADDLRRGITIAANIANEHDYSHLVDGLVKAREEPDRTGLDAMLTDYDRILLRFGMHIACVI